MTVDDGEAGPPRFAITAAPLDLAALMGALWRRAEAVAVKPAAPPADVGAVASFLGVVRGQNLGRRVLRLEYEAYEPLARRALERIGAEAGERWPGVQLAIHHRIGRVELGEASVAIVAASAHRREAFAVCRYAIERIKQIVPIWKHEFFDGGDVWIEGATADPDDRGARQAALERACA